MLLNKDIQPSISHNFTPEDLKRRKTHYLTSARGRHGSLRGGRRDQTRRSEPLGHPRIQSLRGAPRAHQARGAGPASVRATSGPRTLWHSEAPLRSTKPKPGPIGTTRGFLKHCIALKPRVSSFPWSQPAIKTRTSRPSRPKPWNSVWANSCSYWR